MSRNVKTSGATRMKQLKYQRVDAWLPIAEVKRLEEALAKLSGVKRSQFIRWAIARAIKECPDLDYMERHKMMRA